MRQNGQPKAATAKRRSKNVLSTERETLFGTSVCETVDPNGDDSLRTGSWNRAEKFSTGYLVGDTRKYKDQ